MGKLFPSFPSRVSFPRRCRMLCMIGLVFALHHNFGCQTANPGASTALIAHQAMIDFSGLKPAQPIDGLKCTAAFPETWDPLPLKRGALFNNQQWRSPTRNTGVGVVYIRLPIPLPLDTLIWFAKQEYTKKANEGKLLGEWTDNLGRHWFEGENSKYHVRGYVFLNGTDAWLIYFGHKTATPPSAAELSLAARSLDTIIPQAKVPTGDLQASAR